MLRIQLTAENPLLRGSFRRAATACSHVDFVAEQNEGRMRKLLNVVSGKTLSNELPCSFDFRAHSRVHNLAELFLAFRLQCIFLNLLCQSRECTTGRVRNRCPLSPHANALDLLWHVLLDPARQLQT